MRFEENNESSSNRSFGYVQFEVDNSGRNINWFLISTDYRFSCFYDNLDLN
jgi:hypothetical protein